METTMRKIYWAAPLLLLAFLMVFAFGCTEKTGSGNDGGGSGIVGNVQILMGSDTIRYLPGDSASSSFSIQGCGTQPTRLDRCRWLIGPMLHRD